MIFSQPRNAFTRSFQRTQHCNGISARIPWKRDLFNCLERCASLSFIKTFEPCSPLQLIQCRTPRTFLPINSPILPLSISLMQKQMLIVLVHRVDWHSCRMQSERINRVSRDRERDRKNPRERDESKVSSEMISKISD